MPIPKMIRLVRGYMELEDPFTFEQQMWGPVTTSLYGHIPYVGEYFFMQIPAFKQYFEGVVTAGAFSIYLNLATSSGLYEFHFRRSSSSYIDGGIRLIIRATKTNVFYKKLKATASIDNFINWDSLISSTSATVIPNLTFSQEYDKNNHKPFVTALNIPPEGTGWYGTISGKVGLQDSNENLKVFLSIVTLASGSASNENLYYGRIVTVGIQFIFTATYLYASAPNEVDGSTYNVYSFVSVDQDEIQLTNYRVYYAGSSYITKDHTFPSVTTNDGLINSIAFNLGGMNGVRKSVLPRTIYGDSVQGQVWGAPIRGMNLLAQRNITWINVGSPVTDVIITGWGGSLLTGIPISVNMGGVSVVTYAGSSASWGTVSAWEARITPTILNVTTGTTVADINASYDGFGTVELLAATFVTHYQSIGPYMIELEPASMSNEKLNRGLFYESSDAETMRRVCRFPPNNTTRYVILHGDTTQTEIVQSVNLTIETEQTFDENEAIEDLKRFDVVPMNYNQTTGQIDSGYVKISPDMEDGGTYYIPISVTNPLGNTYSTRLKVTFIQGLV